MYTDTELAALKTSNEVQTAIDNAAANSPYASSNSDVATGLGLKRWITTWLRRYYNKTREGLSNHQ